MRAGSASAAALAMLIGFSGSSAAGTERGNSPEASQAALTALINRQIRVEGSFFTPREQQMVIAKCGYRPGEWDGFDANMSQGAFHCTTGRTVDDPEMKAIMAAVAPRIERRVNAVMASPDVRAAIDRVAADATAAAMRRLEDRQAR